MSLTRKNTDLVSVGKGIVDVMGSIDSMSEKQAIHSAKHILTLLKALHRHKEFAPYVSTYLDAFSSSLDTKNTFKKLVKKTLGDHSEKSVGLLTGGVRSGSRSPSPVRTDGVMLPVPEEEERILDLDIRRRSRQRGQEDGLDILATYASQRLGGITQSLANVERERQRGETERYAMELRYRSSSSRMSFIQDTTMSSLFGSLTGIGIHNTLGSLRIVSRLLEKGVITLGKTVGTTMDAGEWVSSSFWKLGSYVGLTEEPIPRNPESNAERLAREFGQDLDVSLKDGRFGISIILGLLVAMLCFFMMRIMRARLSAGPFHYRGAGKTRKHHGRGRGRVSRHRGRRHRGRRVSKKQRHTRKRSTRKR